MDNLLRNVFVISGGIGEDQVTFRRLDELTGPALDLRTSDPALVLRREPGQPKSAWLKADFQRLAKTDAAPELVTHAERDFNRSIDDIRDNSRTVGCMTMLVARCDDGDKYVLVQRTARGPDGTVNLGNISRAGGGANGRINNSIFREAQEECHIFADMGQGRHLAFDIMPVDHGCSARVVQSVMNDRFARSAGIASHVLGAGADTTTIDRMVIPATTVAVPNLTADVNEYIDGGKKIVIPQLAFFDQSENLDINVDRILFARLPGITSSQLRVGDGETDLDGNLLNRMWIVRDLDDMHQAAVNGTAKFSPAAARILKRTPDIQSALLAAAP